MNDNQLRKLIFTQVDLLAYIEQNIGFKLRKKFDGKYESRCPFPYHKDDNPSFSLDYKNGGWVWYCYGCSDGGTVIEFYKRYYGYNHEEAIQNILTDHKIEIDINAQIKAMIQMEGSEPPKKHIESDHLLLCQICLNTMRDYNEDKEVVKLIKDIYSKANEALKTYDNEEIKELICEARKIGDFK